MPEKKNNLIIVESPAKVKTIKKYVGSSYTVDASMGHIRDLPKSRLGVNTEKDFEPEYITIRGKGELLNKLRKEAKAADVIYLATDPDREGEAISWHLLNSLNLDDSKKVHRISFNEITRNAIKESLKNPRDIDMNLVDAQQARRVLDRIVGYKISPILWAKVKRGLSAGRVQSVALKMICDREDEINAFVPEEYWIIEADFGKYTAAYYGDGEEKRTVGSKAECDRILKDIQGKSFLVTDVQVSNRTRKAPLPFTTSTLQQEAGKVLNFASQKTMNIAQQLYESGYITYLRTDSIRISAEADKACRAFVSETYGKDYVTSAGTAVQNGKNIQDAHEAIRPTDIHAVPEQFKEKLPRDSFRLYQLIWKRFTASRMNPAVYDQINIRLSCAGHVFTASGSKLVFDGFLKVYNEEAKSEKNTYIDHVETGDSAEPAEIIPSQHFTQAPPHYTESGLIKALEEQGIGRPSTYAPTITTIIARRYVRKEKKNLLVTELGSVVNRIMESEFRNIVDEKFTAAMEEELDRVADGKTEWKNIIRDFYPDLCADVEKAEKELEKVKIADEESDEICEKCGRRMVIKYGSYGRFLACPGFPECRNTKPFLDKIGVKCPKCGGEIVRKRTRKGRIFYSCENAPSCDYASWDKPSAPKKKEKKD